jgi:hypothetical protein
MIMCLQVPCRPTTCSLGCFQVSLSPVGRDLTLTCIGLLHPLIHLGFGIEFHQPAIIAEALAQACVTNNWIGVYLRTIEKAAVPSSKTLLGLLDEIKAEPKLHAAVDWSEENKIQDGILKNAPGEMIHYAKQWTVSPGELEKKTAEMISTDAYFAAAAQHPPKQASIVFFQLCELAVNEVANRSNSTST